MGQYRSSDRRAGDELLRKACRIGHAIAVPFLGAALGALGLSCRTVLEERHAADEQQYDYDVLYERYVAMHKDLITKLWPEEKWTPEDLPAQEEMSIIRGRCARFTEFIHSRRFSLYMGIGFDYFAVVNRSREEAILKKEKLAPRIPSRKPDEVIKAAKEYLDRAGIRIPENFTVLDVQFGKLGWKPRDPVWYVVWRPAFGLATPDDSMGLMDSDYIRVELDDELGLVWLVYSVGVYPDPKYLEPKISRALAVKKAAKYAQQMINSSEYTGWYGSAERVISGVRDARLVVYEPNWVLHPIRSHMGLKDSLSPPRETRLCWRVQVDVSLAEVDKDGKKRLKDGPMFWIFIDAVTGQCVGVNY